MWNGQPKQTAFRCAGWSHMLHMDTSVNRHLLAGLPGPSFGLFTSTVQPQASGQCTLRAGSSCRVYIIPHCNLLFTLTEHHLQVAQSLDPCLSSQTQPGEAADESDKPNVILIDDQNCCIIAYVQSF